MTISSAIKRLQFLEDKHGGHLEIKMVDELGDVFPLHEEIIFDVSNPGTGKVCAIMPQSVWEEITPKGIQHDAV